MIDAAYAAGLFDGEGCIHIGMAGRKYHSLQLIVSNTSLPALNWLQARWGGSVRQVATHPRQTRPCWRWAIATRQAAAFLVSVRPYLIIKADQADNALAFQRSRGGHYDEALTATFKAEDRRLKVVSL